MVMCYLHSYLCKSLETLSHSPQFCRIGPHINWLNIQYFAEAHLKYSSNDNENENENYNDNDNANKP